MKNIYAIVLGGGKGTRLNAKELPKVLFKVGGKPMIRYVIEALEKVADKIVVVVGFQGKKILEELDNEDLSFVWQKKQLGTAHAVLQARPILEGKRGITIIANGDHPLFTRRTFERLINKFKTDGWTLLITSALEDAHPQFGRVVREARGKVIGIREVKDATKDVLKIREKNVGFYVVDNKWLWQALPKIKKSPVSGEYYITDLVELAIREGKGVEALPVENPGEIKGINTPEELKEVERILSS